MENKFSFTEGVYAGSREACILLVHYVLAMQTSSTLKAKLISFAFGVNILTFFEFFETFIFLLFYKVHYLNLIFPLSDELLSFTAGKLLLEVRFL